MEIGSSQVWALPESRDKLRQNQTQAAIPRELDKYFIRSHRHAELFEPLVLDRAGCCLVVCEPLGFGGAV